MFVYFFKVGCQDVLLLGTFQHVRLFFYFKILQCSFIRYSFLCSFIRYLRVLSQHFQEFIRVGYYVSNEYSDPEMQETPPEQPLFDKLTRNILASNPRVTKFKINWDNQSSQVRQMLRLYPIILCSF